MELSERQREVISLAKFHIAQAVAMLEREAPKLALDANLKLVSAIVDLDVLERL